MLIENMKPNIFHRFWIFTKSIFFILHISITTIYDGYRGKMTREKSDNRLRWMSRNILNVMGIKLRRYNEQILESIQPGRPYMFFINHSSLLDIPIVLDSLPGSIRMITKKELFRVPIWGKGLEVGEFISVDRQNRNRALEDLKKAKKKMETGIQLAIFPEGTRSTTGEILPFKRGVFHLAVQTEAIIIPIRIHGAFEILPPKTWDVVLNREVEVHIGQPVDTVLFDANNINALVQEVRNQIQSM